jgi:hypothetical protein
LPGEIITAELCGSFRRQKTIGDLDIIITRNDDGSILGILDCLIKKIKKNWLYKRSIVIKFQW